MENASNALMLSASILISILIISGIMMFYRQSGELVSSVDNSVNSQLIDKYNDPFTRLAAISETNDMDGKGIITIYDIVSVVNYAKNINDSLDYTTTEHNQNGNENYIVIDMEVYNDNNNNGTFEPSEKVTKEDISGSNQTTYHEWIKKYSGEKYNFQISIDNYNSFGKINKVTFKQRI